MNIKTYRTEEKTFSGSMSINMDKEFLYADFPTLQKKNSPVYGCESADEIVISPLNVDQLGFLLESEGTHMILFGGSWSKETCAVIDRINYFAKQYGVPVIHQFDFAIDGIAEHTIKQDITAQPGYDGPGKDVENSFANYNYFYGEYCTRHLTNLNDWVAAKAGVNGDITYLNLYEDAVSVPNLCEPFLFLYNRSNTVNYAGTDTKADRYPVMFAMELGSLLTNGVPGPDFDEALQNGIFRHIGKECGPITNRSKADHMREAFNALNRGHSIKTDKAFEEGEQINLQMINLQEFRWLLNQKGTFVIHICGPWCTFSQGSVTTINDYAVANDVRVYIADIRMDDKYQIDFWQYPRKNQMSYGSPEFQPYFFELWEQYLTNAEVLTSNSTRSFKGLYHYTDEAGEEHTLMGVGVPYLLCYDKDHLTGRGHRQPVLASRHDSGQLINNIPNYAYYEPVYKEYKGSVLKVFSAYTRNLGISSVAKECLVDRTKPMLEGHESPNPNVSGLKDIPHKEHNWWVERADRN